MNNKIFSILLSIIVMSITMSACVKDPGTTVTPTTLTLGAHALFIANQGSGHNDGSLDCYELDGATYHSNVFTTVNGIKLGDYPNDLVAKGTDSLYIVVENANAIYLVNRHTAQLLKTYAMPAGTTPFKMALINDSLAAVTGYNSSSVLLLNLRTGAIDATGSTGPNPEAITYIGNRLVVCAPGFGDKREVDFMSFNPTFRISIAVGDNPVAVLGASDSLAIILCQGFYSPATNSEIIFINPKTRVITGRIPLAHSGAGAIAIDGNLLYVPVDTLVLRIDIAKVAVRDTIATGVAGFAIAVDNVTHWMYLTDYKNILHIFNDQGHAVGQQSTGTFPGSLVITH